MRRLVAVLLLLFSAAGVLAQIPDINSKMREAQQALGASDCDRAQAALREVIAVDPQNYVAHLLSTFCLLRQKSYGDAVGEYRRALELRPDAPQPLLGLIRAYALSGDTAHRDAETEDLLSLMRAGKIPTTFAFVREQFNAGDESVVASEYRYFTLLRIRYAFDVSDAPQKILRHLELVSRKSDQAAFRRQHPREAAAGVREFSLVSSQPTPPSGWKETTVRVYDRGEPAYEQVVADVKAIVAGHALSAGSYALATNPAVVEPIPITVDDPSDPRMRLQPGQVAIGACCVHIGELSAPRRRERRHVASPLSGTISGTAKLGR